jgi:hypothetical protein
MPIPYLWEAMSGMENLRLIHKRPLLADSRHTEMFLIADLSTHVKFTFCNQ